MKGLKDAMTKNIYQLITQSAARYPTRPALHFKHQTLTYAELQQGVSSTAALLQHCDVQRFDRVAVYLPKQFETVYSLFGSAMAGAVFVPVNPGLKAAQVAHILQDCNVRVLVTSKARLADIEAELHLCTDLHTVLLTDASAADIAPLAHIQVKAFALNNDMLPKVQPDATDADMAAILYTSGSTGKPKGVVLSHRNMLVGAQSVASYLNNSCDDVVLALLPLSFDYGQNQLLSTWYAGGRVVPISSWWPGKSIKPGHASPGQSMAAADVGRPWARLLAGA